MNFILIITLLLSSLAYGSENDEKSNHLKPEENLKKKLYLLYKDAGKKNGEERTKAIEAIKVFYNEHTALNYNDDYHIYIFGEGYNPNHGKSPLAFALQHDLALASFLINEKNVEVKNQNQYLNSDIHYIIPSIIKVGLQEKHKNMLTLLVKKGSNINGIGIPQRTPLAEYIHRSKKVDPCVFREFFNQGALIVTKQERMQNYVSKEPVNKVFTCNLLATSFKQEGVHSYETANRNLATYIPLVATIFKERVHNLKKTYLNHLYFFAQLNKQIGHLKIPKYLVHTIINLAIQEDESLVDIKKSITDKEEVETQKMVIHKRIERLDYETKIEHLTILDRVKQSPELRDCKNLCWMLSKEFWSRPLRTCIQELDEIISHNSLQEIEEPLTKHAKIDKN